MTDRVTLTFTNAQHDLYLWVKGNPDAFKQMKEVLQEFKDGKRAPVTAEQLEEHEDRSAKLESLMIRIFSDLKTGYKDENEFIVLNGGEAGAATAIYRRFGDLYAKCAGDNQLFLDARIEFERKYPKLAKIAGMTE